MMIGLKSSQNRAIVLSLCMGSKIRTPYATALVRLRGCLLSKSLLHKTKGHRRYNVHHLTVRLSTEAQLISPKQGLVSTDRKSIPRSDHDTHYTFLVV